MIDHNVQNDKNNCQVVGREREEWAGEREASAHLIQVGWWQIYPFKLSTYRQYVSVRDKIFLFVTYCLLQELSREVEESRRDAEERRSRSRGVVVEEDGVDHQVLDEVSGEMPARIADMEAEIRTLREANKSKQKT